MKHGSLFSGIGGFDLAAEWMGWENVFHCEWNDFGKRILKYYWPNAISYNDITKTDFTIHRGSIDILTGGFPCQPYSTAGKRLGKADERHLWPSMLRAIREIRPRWVVGENVLGLVNWSDGLVFEEVCAALEVEGYEVQPFVLPACAVNAPHRRDRVWFVAHARDNGDTRDTAKVPTEAAQKNGRGTQSGTASGEQIQLPNESDTLFRHASQNTISDGLLCGESQQEGAEVRQQRDISAGDTKRICGEEMAGAAADTMRDRIDKSGYWGQSEQLDTDGIEGGTIANAKSIGQEYALENRELERGRFRKSNQRNVWDAFPSVSPLCIGDDGVSDRLDGITFSRWRQESIKGGGNAVVPQVVLQIFKVIEEYETKHTS